MSSDKGRQSSVHGDCLRTSVLYDRKQIQVDKGKGRAACDSKGTDRDNETGTRIETDSMFGRVHLSTKTLMSTTFYSKDLSSRLAQMKETGEASASALFPAHQAGFASANQTRCLVQDGFSNIGGLHGSSSHYVAFTEGPALMNVQHKAADRHINRTPTNILEYSLLDGMDVVDILGQPEYSIAAAESDRAPRPRMGTERLRAAMIGSSGIKNVWDGLLNFEPSFLTVSETSQADARTLMGTSDVAEAQRTWLQQWESVLSSYTDEVWGDLGSLAAEAWLEMSQCTGPASQHTDFTALQRLRSILSHIRGF